MTTEERATDPGLALFANHPDPLHIQDAEGNLTDRNEAWCQLFGYGPGDPEARRIARLAIQRGDDLGLGKAERVFLYLPLEHSEDLLDQWLSEALISALGDSDWTFYARRHREIVERFGRFRHRNDVLGRETTPAEAAFLEEPHSRF